MSHLPKHRILELIGDKRYDSAFLTTYAFDFAFFETVFMRQLKANHIININLLADINQLQGSLGFTTGAAKSISRGYSIAGIESPGVFHPKILLFLGQKEAAIIIGSGNITPSGYGRNMEIWGAFHINGPQDPKAGLVLQVWDYLKSILQEIPGFTNLRLTFAEENARWINEIVPQSNSIINNNQVINFFHNDKGGGIREKLRLSINTPVSRITIISPYFDKELQMVQGLKEDYNPNEIRIIMPSSGELLPEKVSDELKALISFTKWEGLIDDNRKLHAKIVHLETTGTSEYLLFGSPNATLAGFGFSDRFNAEYAVLLENPNKYLLRHLGFSDSLPKHSFSEYNRIFKPESDKPFNKSETYNIGLKAVDQDGNLYKLYVSNEGSSKGLIAILFDAYGSQVGSFPLEKKDTYLQFSTEEKIISNALYVQIFSNGSAVSNKQVIQELHEILKGNPSPDQRKLKEYFSLIDSGAEDLTVLLDFLVFDDDDVRPQIKKTSSISEKTKEDQTEKQYEKLSYEDLMQEEQYHLQLKYKSLQSKETQILEYLLNYLFKQEPDARATQKEDEEEEDDLNTGKGRNEDPGQFVLENADLEFKEYNRIANRIKKHLIGYRNHLRALAISANDQEKPNELSDKEFSRFIIALQFVILYGGKYQSVKIPVKEVDSKHKNREEYEINYLPYIPFTGDLKGYNYKSLVIDIIGDFLWLIKSMYLEKLNDPLRISNYMRHAILNCIYCITTLPYHDDHEPYKNLKEVMLLNAIESFEQDNLDIINDPEFQENFQELASKAAHKDEAALSKAIAWFDRFDERYRIFKNEMDKAPHIRQNIKSVRQLNVNDIVYRSEYGFCAVHRLKDDYAAKDGTILMRPGLHDKHDDDPILSEPLPNERFISL
jgi:hypothetical protein